jgi:hypothetical protein
MAFHKQDIARRDGEASKTRALGGSIGWRWPVRSRFSILAVERRIRCKKCRHGMALFLRKYCRQQHLRRRRGLLCRVVSGCLIEIERNKGRKREKLCGGP